MNKRLINIMLIMIFLVSLISFSVNAAPRDIFRAGLDPIEDFFTGGWQNYEKTVAFIVFFFLFFSAFLIGMKKAFKELTRAHIVFAFAAAFLSAFIIATTMRFDWMNLKYIAWFLIAILILFALYSLFSKMFGEHKFWAFLLAIIITLLLLWLIWYLMSEGRALDGFGRISDAFGRFGKEKIPKREPLREGAPITPEERLQVEGVKPPVAPPEKRKFGKYLWMIVAIIAVITAVAGSIGKLRGRGFFGGVKDFYGYPFSAARKGYKRVKINWIFKRRLRKLINDTLKILREPGITEKERQEVARNLQQARETINQIIDQWVNPTESNLRTYRDRIQGSSTRQAQQAQNVS